MDPKFYSAFEAKMRTKRFLPQGINLLDNVIGLRSAMSAAKADITTPFSTTAELTLVAKAAMEKTFWICFNIAVLNVFTIKFKNDIYDRYLQSYVMLLDSFWNGWNVKSGTWAPEALLYIARMIPKGWSSMPKSASADRSPEFVKKLGEYDVIVNTMLNEIITKGPAAANDVVLKSLVLGHPMAGDIAVKIIDWLRVTKSVDDAHAIAKMAHRNLYASWSNIPERFNKVRKYNGDVYAEVELMYPVYVLIEKHESVTSQIEPSTVATIMADPSLGPGLMYNKDDREVFAATLSKLVYQPTNPDSENSNRYALMLYWRSDLAFVLCSSIIGIKLTPKILEIINKNFETYQKSVSKSAAECGYNKNDAFSYLMGLTSRGRASCIQYYGVDKNIAQIATVDSLLLSANPKLFEYNPITFQMAIRMAKENSLDNLVALGLAPNGRINRLVSEKDELAKQYDTIKKYLEVLYSYMDGVGKILDNLNITPQYQ
jgi:hypothetical protein